MLEHVKQKEKLAVTDARQSGREPACGAAFVLSLYGILVALPILA